MKSSAKVMSMSKIILRKTKDAAVSAADAITLVTDLTTRGRVLSSSGNNVLADVPSSQISNLASRLSGWIVSEQTATVPVPDPRLRARKS